MTRAHDACRRDLMNARHRVSKMLLRHGRVYPKPTTWTAEHRRWLSAQQFDEPASDLVFADLLATVDGLTVRKQRSRCGSPNSRPTSAGGRPSPGCERFAGSTRSPRSRSISSSALTGSASSAPRRWRVAGADAIADPVR